MRTCHILARDRTCFVYVLRDMLRPALRYGVAQFWVPVYLQTLWQYRSHPLTIHIGIASNSKGNAFGLDQETAM
jgi:hypothetical protein